MADLSSTPAVSLQRTEAEITVLTQLEGLDHRSRIVCHGGSFQVYLKTCESFVCQHSGQCGHPDNR